MWFVYIVECSDKTLYTGITTDIERRLREHNSGNGAKYTANRAPVMLRALFIADNRSEASKEEFRIKKLKRNEKIKLFNI